MHLRGSLTWLMLPPKELSAIMLKAKCARPAWLNVHVNAVKAGCILRGGIGMRNHLDIATCRWPASHVHH